MTQTARQTAMRDTGTDRQRDRHPKRDIHTRTCIHIHEDRASDGERQRAREREERGKFADLCAKDAKYKLHLGHFGCNLAD